MANWRSPRCPGDADGVYMMSATKARRDPVHNRDSRLRQVVEVAVAAVAALLMVDRAAAHTGPAHWVHLRVRRFIRRCSAAFSISVASNRAEDAYEACVMSATKAWRDPAHDRDSELRRVVEMALAVAATLLMVDRMAAYTRPAHWVHRRIHRFIRILGLGPRSRPLFGATVQKPQNNHKLAGRN
jgi:hypothetical protein